MKILFRVIVVIELIVIVSSALYLRSVPYFDKLGSMGVPLCVADKHKFISDTCDECNNSIIDNGVFISKSKLLDVDYIKFKDYYSNYNDFKSELDKTHISEAILFIGFFCFIVTFIIKFILSRKKKEVK